METQTGAKTLSKKLSSRYHDESLWNQDLGRVIANDRNKYTFFNSNKTAPFSKILAVSSSIVGPASQFFITLSVEVWSCKENAISYA